MAHDAIELLTGPYATKLRACHATRCVLYFVKSHPRREWCSRACGNRVRAARHYQRIRAEHDGPETARACGVCFAANHLRVSAR